MWEVCKQIGNDEDICEEHSELHKLIFMFVSNEDFIIVTKDVLQVTVSILFTVFDLSFACFSRLMHFAT